MSGKMQKELDKLQRLRDVAFNKFKRKATTLEEQITKEAKLETLSRCFIEMDSAYNKVEEAHELYLEKLIHAKDLDTDFEKEESFMNTVDSLKITVTSAYDNVAQKSNDAKDSIATKPKIKVKPIDPPKFDGDIREYPTFKTDYHRIMTATYGDNPFALKQCLSGEALETVRGVEDDFEEMVKRLDQRYGDPTKLADRIINEIKGIDKIPEGNNRKLIYAINTIEQCWLDMKRFNLEHELSTVSVISLIEKILPTEQKKEWVRIYHQLTDKSKTFPRLLKFLLDEKQILGYMDDDVRCNKNIKGAVNSVDIEKDHSIDRALKELREKQSSIESMLSQMIINKQQTHPHQQRWQEAACWLHNTNYHTIEQCQGFDYLSNIQKITAMKKNGVCFKCIKRGHLSKDCQQPPTCRQCNQHHHTKLHGVLNIQTETQGAVHTTGSIGGNVMLPVQRVHCKNQLLTAVYDSGSTISLITHDKAQQLGLENSPVKLTITRVGNISQTTNTKQYIVPLADSKGNIQLIQAFGMDEITHSIPYIDEGELSRIFDIQEKGLHRPHGNVEILLGLDSCNLFPKVVRTVDNLQLLENIFGYCVRGSILNYSANNRSYTAQVNHMAILSNSDDFLVQHTNSDKQDIDSFFDNNVNNEYQAKCKNCKNCTTCCKIENITIKEDKELQIIRKGLNYNAEKRVWHVNYAWIKDPNLLPNNFIVAKIKLMGTEKRIRKLGTIHTASYCEQMTDMFDRKVARKLTNQEIQSYQGPIHYISHHEILKPTSHSTPFRIVFNSSAPFNGHILNDYWAKGPDILNNIFGLHLRFREGLIAFVGDISKMFNTVHLSIFDQHVHRFLWRNMQTEREPDICVLTAVPFGDRPSGCIVMLAMKETASMMKDEYPLAYKIIDEDSYVDDILHSLDNVEDVMCAIKDVEYVLGQGGFKVKSWTISGTDNSSDKVHLLESENERVLGVEWNPKYDEFRFETKINFSAKNRGVRVLPNLTKDNVDVATPEILTKRLVLSQIATVYDPLGLISPFILKGKLLMRKLISYTDGKLRKLDWDDPIPQHLRNEWCEYFKELFQLENVRIPRCIKTSKTVTEPTLIMFCDASMQAYGACAYVRWKVSEDNFNCKLLASKTRVAPIKSQTIPKLELSSALLSARLRKSIINECKINFERVIHLTDSEIVFFQLIKDDIKLGTYVANRVIEIQEYTNTYDWLWIPTQHNIADILTRPISFNKEAEARWIKGPEFLYHSPKEWPTKTIEQLKKVKNDNQENINTVYLTTNCEVIGLDIIDATQFISYKKLLHITAMVLNIFKKKSFKGAINFSSHDVHVAEMRWVKHVQTELMGNWNVRFKRLGPFINDGILFVGSRIASWMKENWNQEAFILLPSHHIFTKLCIQSYHDQDHSGIEATLCKIQSRFWIPHARKLLKRIKRECLVCRKVEKKIVGQSMGPTNEKRLKPSPPFYNSALDLFGPFLIKDTVKGRTRKKVYGIIINCLVTRASYIDLVEGYDTDSLLTTLRRFISLRGFPKTIYSDYGSQMVLADKNLKDLIKDLDHHKLTSFGKNEGLNWSFTKSADAPWENGCSEALIRLIKRHIARIIGDNILTFGELQTALFEIGNLLNERPIGTKPGSNIDSGIYLCPNDLLLGRSGLPAPQGIFDISNNVKSRQEFLNKITENFWKKWIQNYFHTLIIRQKWHTAVRNLQKGDIVLVQDSNTVRGHWRLAQVSDVLPSSDDKVRDVLLRYKQQKDDKSYHGIQDTTIKRSAHRIVLLLPVEEQ